MIHLSNEIKNAFDSLNLNEHRYLLAFSGGPDSVYLLWMLSFYYGNTLKDHIFLCYINYHDSPYVDKEERIVMEYISKFNLSYLKKDVYYDKTKDKNFEEWARDYRYSLFLDIVKEKNLKGVLTAHQKTDVIETFLLQKERKNYPLYYGLKKENNLYGLNIYRPLLMISKQELTEELDKENIPYYFDITNTNLKKKRNFIRHELTEEDISFYEKEIEKENDRVTQYLNIFSIYKTGMPFLVYESKDIEFKKRYCFYLLDQIDDLENRESLGKELFDFLKKKTSGIFPITDNILLYRTSKEFFLHSDYKKIIYSFSFHEKGIYENEFFRIDLTDPKNFNFSSFPITIRNRKDDDRISTDLPTKDIKKALQKQSVPFYLLDCYPIIEQNGKIICVPFYKDIKEKKIPLILKFYR